MCAGFSNAYSRMQNLQSYNSKQIPTSYYGIYANDHRLAQLFNLMGI